MGDGVASGSISESHGEHLSIGSIENNAGSNINRFDLLIDEAISNDSGSEQGYGDDSNGSSGSDECSSICNRLDLLMDDENMNMSNFFFKIVCNSFYFFFIINMFSQLI